VIEPRSILVGEAYARHRRQHLHGAIAYRRSRSLRLGEHLLLQFEDQHTIRHQIQEILRAEGVEDEAGVREQIDTYARLLPDARNLKLCLMVQIPDAAERRRLLPRLAWIGDHIYLELDGLPRVRAIANEDLHPADRRLSAVHFLRIELDERAAHALREGRPFALGCDHPEYAKQIPVPADLRARLSGDLHEAATRHAASCALQ